MTLATRPALRRAAILAVGSELLTPQRTDTNSLHITDQLNRLGIDVVLKQAWDKGIVLGGASAGSLCWFEEGTTDSRPKELTTVQCLGFLKGSHSPHYDREPGRRPLYQKLILSGEMKPGYACDNDAGIYFEDNEVKRVVHTRPEAKVYYVSVVGGKIVEKLMEPETIP